MTLAEFILARVAELRAKAQAVLDSHEMHDWESYVASAGMHTEPAHDFAVMNDPARVLRQCEAFLRIVQEHYATDPFNNEGDRYCANCLHPEDRTGYPDYWTQQFYPCATLRHLAEIWSDHDDYRQDWKW